MTAFGIRLQKIRIHGNPPLNNKLTVAQSHLPRASEGALKLWIKETTKMLMLVKVRGFYLVSELPSKVGYRDLHLTGRPKVWRRFTNSVIYRANIRVRAIRKYPLPRVP